MSEDQVSTVSEANTELDALKELARDMGIEFKNSIGLVKLRERVADFDSSSLEAPAAEAAPVVTSAKRPSITELKAQSAKLVRVRVACMNPNKREWEGELFCTGNAKIGTFKKFVPFDVEWHVPNIILTMIQQRKCQVFVSKKIRTDSGIVVPTKTGKLIKEYAVEILPALTDAERKGLAQRQAMSAGTAAE